MRLIYLAMVAAFALCVRANSAEPVLKQEPEGSLKAYFIRKPLPNYPDTAISFHKKGIGWFRLQIDMQTGAVREVKVLKSTGVKILDDSAAAAFLQWKAKPHLIDHAVIEVRAEGFKHTGSHIDW